ncbi:hypothetical protein RHGRI_008961 [Rhododendron griersonianum]|uniref:Uncharacterized protein n=1 Tax=Rhododendron griersonianum TaxID=479676 RepID=A0AAV6L2F5_9ERIC|nr:hypothetical protein RHGRI_008961 [Rhododendron griersonianum]
MAARLQQLQSKASQASQFVGKHGSTIPGRTETFWKELDFVKNAWKNRKDLKVEDAGIAALFGLECFAWFCAGEIVGRGFTFTGYYP